jgi:hypothetical protein
MRYNCAFTIEKNGNTEPKFETVSSDSNNKDYILNLIQKKYKDFSITVKYIKESINGKANIL